MGYDWEYIDVAEYVRTLQKDGKCEDVKILETVGAETHLLEEHLHVSFRVDGILRQLSTNEYYLFEFKNQTSFKYRDKKHVDESHINQVVCYCTILELNKALVLYENRDVCELVCPEVFEVTDEMKKTLCLDKLLTCEEYVRNLTPPPKCDNEKYCKWCDFKRACRKVG
jgi:ferredoxin